MSIEKFHTGIPWYCTHVWATEGLEACTWQTKDNMMAEDSRITDLQLAVNTGLFTGWRAQDRCTLRQLVKTATLEAGVRS